MAGVAVGSVAAVDALPFPALNFRAAGETGLQRSPASRKPRRMELSSSFVGAWRPSLACSRRKQRRRGGLVVLNDLGGQYEESYEDINHQLLNYFTYKAVRTVLHQLYEMNPPNYRWFHNFVATNKPSDGKRFLRILVKEKQDLAERVMITRLHLYGKWIKKCDHGKMYERISEENLELMRERLMETVIWPTDDSSSEMIG